MKTQLLNKCRSGVMMNEKIKKIYYYNRKDKRKVVIIYYFGGDRRTMSYPKYIMEQKLGRPLTKIETVHHIDGDLTNNEDNNFEVKNNSEHAKYHAKRLFPLSFVCPYCNVVFIISGKRLYGAISNRKRGKVGPFCNRSCAGKYGSGIQNGKMQKLEVKYVVPKYTNWKSKQT